MPGEEPPGDDVIHGAEEGGDVVVRRGGGVEGELVALAAFVAGFDGAVAEGVGGVVGVVVVMVVVMVMVVVGGWEGDGYGLVDLEAGEEVGVC